MKTKRAKKSLSKQKPKSFREWIKNKDNWFPYFLILLIIGGIILLAVSPVAFGVVLFFVLIVVYIWSDMRRQRKRKTAQQQRTEQPQTSATEELTLTDQDLTVVDNDNLRVKVGLADFPHQGQDVVVKITLKEKALNRFLDDNRPNQEAYHRVLHEMKNSLTVLKGNLSLMRKDKKQVKKVKLMQAAVSQMEKLTEDNLLLGQLSQEEVCKQFRFVRLKPLVQEVIDCLGVLAQRNRVRLITYLSDLKIQGNNLFLKVLFHNLIENAIKYSREGSKVEIYLFELDQKIIFKVIDQGKGITPQDLKGIFAPFKRGRNAQTVVSGNGLGLAIVKNIAEVHGGTVGVDSKLGEGSAFWVELPA